MPEDGAGGPLAGVRVVELAGIGPGPFCVMLLADMGASVVRVDRVGGASADYTVNPVIERGRRSVAVDLKSPDGVQVVLDLVRDADVLLESYRPGVAERLGIGPAECHEANERLVYARLSGFGQDGPWAGVAGHDINYIGLTGALWSIGRAGERPVPPINLVGDLGGGAASMAFGIVCALLEARTQRPRPGRRRQRPRRHDDDHGVRPGAPGAGRVGASTGARTCSTPGPPTTTPTPAPTAGGSPWAPSRSGSS